MNAASRWRRVSVAAPLVITLVSLLLASAAVPAQAAAPFACTDYTQGKVYLVGADGTIAWEYQTKHCNDLWVLPNGNVLFNTGRGVQVLDAEGRPMADATGH